MDSRYAVRRRSSAVRASRTSLLSLRRVRLAAPVGNGALKIRRGRIPVSLVSRLSASALMATLLWRRARPITIRSDSPRVPGEPSRLAQFGHARSDVGR